MAIRKPKLAPRTGRNFYQVLGVPPAASRDAIRDAWLALASKYHPDRCKQADAHDMMAEINLAYTALKDSDRRRNYDTMNRVRESYCPKCAGTGELRVTKFGKKGGKSACPVCEGSGYVRH